MTDLGSSSCHIQKDTKGVCNCVESTWASHHLNCATQRILMVKHGSYITLTTAGTARTSVNIHAQVIFKAGDSCVGVLAQLVDGKPPPHLKERNFLPGAGYIECECVHVSQNLVNHAYKAPNMEFIASEGRCLPIEESSGDGYTVMTLLLILIPILLVFVVVLMAMTYRHRVLVNR
eukprot:5486275-Pyramimonas_sp.AAC.1